MIFLSNYIWSWLYNLVIPAPCKTDIDCRAGRVCHAGSCVCGDETLCARHTHPVCGSDGIVYPSHCELHRQACLHHKHIKVDSEGTACANQNKNPPTTVATKNNTLIRGKCGYSNIHFLVILSFLSIPQTSEQSTISLCVFSLGDTINWLEFRFCCELSRLIFADYWKHYRVHSETAMLVMGFMGICVKVSPKIVMQIKIG